MSRTLISPFSPPSCSSQQKAQRNWLLSTAFLLWAMIMLGAATRLTKSGLSIVEWRPLTGIIPPLTESDWWAQFALYQQSPEYQKINTGMPLSEFKFIFLMEYSHRLLGRLIGVWFFVPLIWFAAKRAISAAMIRYFSVIFLLGAFQGVFGWYMVKSGLINEPSVSHYRLAGHLVLAIIILGMVLWSSFSLMKPEPSSRGLPSSTRTMMLISTTFTGITILYGALVSGLKAGLIYNTYPLMEGRFIPAEWLDLHPIWMNFLENTATVQWIHRWVAIMAVLLIGHSAGKIYRKAEDPELRTAALLLLATGLFQVLLGILTLLHQVPVFLGVLHQGNAILLFSLCLWVIYQITPKKACAS